MARESTITQAAVSEAADRIKTAGGTPTARAIREALGTGSMATVLRLLQTWQSGQAQPAPREVVIPTALQQMIASFVTKEVASAKAELQAELVTAQQSLADVIAESERQSSELAALADQLSDMATERDQAVAIAAERVCEIDRLTVTIQNERAAAQDARIDLAKAQLRLESLPRLEAEIERLQGLLAAEQQARTAADLAAAVAIARLEERTGSVAGTAV
ncbi:MAG: DNA-binding protein [Candidatus Accumulibacter sp.]|nr:DNA-binding protein [Accumulibacter sp.]